MVEIAEQEHEVLRRLERTLNNRSPALTGVDSDLSPAFIAIELFTISKDAFDTVRQQIDDLGAALFNANETS